MRAVYGTASGMRFVLPGGSGQVGQLLARAFQADGHDVVVLARRPAPSAGRVVAWDGETLGPWAAELDGADVVINLAGRSVNCRYTPANRAAMLDSRVRSTRVVGEAIAQAARPPALWIQASTATIYAHTFGPRARRARHDRRRRAGRAGHVAVQHRGGDGVGARARRRVHAAHAQDRAALGDDDEPGPRRRVRHAARAGAARPRRDVGRRPAVRVVGAPRGLHPRHPLADRARRRRRPGQRLRARAAAQRGVHAGAARGLGHARRPARHGLDARARRRRPPHRDRAHPEEPPRRAGPAPPARVRVPFPRLAVGGARAGAGLAVRPTASGSPARRRWRRPGTGPRPSPAPRGTAHRRSPRRPGHAPRSPPRRAARRRTRRPTASRPRAGRR